MDVFKMLNWGLPPVLVILLLRLDLHERFASQPQDSYFPVRLPALKPRPSTLNLISL